MIRSRLCILTGIRMEAIMQVVKSGLWFLPAMLGACLFLVPGRPAQAIINGEAVDAAGFSSYVSIRGISRFPSQKGAEVNACGGTLIAIEGAEGTDGLLMRLPETARGGVLVKRPKPGQEMRIDMPVIGPQTVATAAERGLAGIAVAAGNVLVADKAEVIRGANGAGLFVMGVAGASSSPASAGRSGSAKGRQRARTCRWRGRLRRAWALGRARQRGCGWAGGRGPLPPR